MTLTEAIAELRRGRPWGGSWAWKDVQDTICKAALSGELVPVQCCMCGKTELSIKEGDSGQECQLDDGRWTCSRECWDQASDSRLAVALAYQQALTVAVAAAEGDEELTIRERGGEDNGRYLRRVSRAEGVNAAAARVMLALEKLIPTDALAEVVALRDERDAAEDYIVNLEAHIEGTAKDTHKLLLAAEAKLAEWQASEKEVSDAYLRIREKLGAWGTAQGGADRFAVTEDALGAVLARAEAEQARGDRLADKLVAAEARADAAVTVKPLVWYDCTDETSHDDGCLYEIEPHGKWFRLMRASTGPGAYIGDFDKRSEAKAAAQADHDALARSAIGGVE